MEPTSTNKALVILEALSFDDLLTMCDDAYKDMYGVHGREFMQHWDQDRLLEWWHEHYVWDVLGQCWNWQLKARDVMAEPPTQEEYHSIDWDSLDSGLVFSYSWA